MIIIFFYLFVVSTKESHITYSSLVKSKYVNHDITQDQQQKPCQAKAT